MNHDYAHCADFTEKCPKSCFRAQLVRDLKAGVPVSFMHLKDTSECPLNVKKKETVQIVIDIPKEYYELLKRFSDEHCTMDMLLLKNGKPLPKGIIATDKAIRIVRKYLGYSDGKPYDTVDAIIEDIMDEADKEVDE